MPFDEATLASLYPTKRDYVEQYDSATAQLLRQGFVLREDVAKLRSIARKVTRECSPVAWLGRGIV